jgi:hypothetical protein
MNEEDLPWRYRFTDSRPLTPLERTAFRVMIELLILFWLCVIFIARCNYG